MIGPSLQKPGAGSLLLRVFFFTGMPMELYLIRHTTPEVPRGTSYGRSDVPLRPTFLEELGAVKKKLDGLAGMVYFSSPLQRCVRLAKGLGGGDPVIDRRLIEIDFGDWEMKSWEGGETLHVLQGIIERPAPNGESYRQVQQRAVSFLDEIAAEAHERVAAVTHAGVVRVLVAHVLRMPLDRLFTLVPSLGSLTRIDVDGSGQRLVFFNR